MTDDTHASAPDAKTLDVTTLESWHYLIEENVRCCSCADKLKIGEQAVYVPSAWFPDVNGAVEPSHAHCAVKDGYRLRYRGEAGWNGDN